jgi:hypothetical protein
VMRDEESQIAEVDGTVPGQQSENSTSDTVR